MKIRESLKNLIQQFQYLPILLITVVILTANYGNALAVEHSGSLFSQDLKNELIRNIGESKSLADLQVNNLSKLEQVPSTTQLMKLSVYLRNFARNLSSSSPVKNLIITTPQINYKITDVKLTNGNWNTLNAGHLLRLITEEMAVINNSQPQLKIQVLLKSDINSIYQPLIDLPLHKFCNLLLEQL